MRGLKGLNNRKGFTLIELIMAVSISIIVIGTISTILVQSYKSYHKVTDNSTTLNAMNSVLEDIREYTFNVDTMQISDEAAVPAEIEGKTTIACIDNTLYVDGNVLYTADSLSVASLELSFTRTGEKKLKCSIDVKNADGDAVVKAQELELFLNNISVIGGLESGNCITFTKTEATS